MSGEARVWPLCPNYGDGPSCRFSPADTKWGRPGIDDKPPIWVKLMRSTTKVQNMRFREIITALVQLLLSAHLWLIMMSVAHLSNRLCLDYLGIATSAL